MNSLWEESWFWWTVALVVGLPILLIALTELQNALIRRHSPLAGPVAMLRNFALPAVAEGMRLERFASGELLQHEGVVPDGMRFIRRGRVSMRATVPRHGVLQLDELTRGEYMGITTLTKETVTPTAVAVDEVEVVFVPQDVMEDLVRQTPLMARDFGRELDLRRGHYRELVARTLAPTNGSPALSVSR
jgi:CRP-like cAMP-binding protein